MPTMKEKWIDYAYESNPADPVGFARICAQAAIKGGELDDAVRWKEVIIAIQDEIRKSVMEPLKDAPTEDNSRAP